MRQYHITQYCQHVFNLPDFSWQKHQFLQGRFTQCSCGQPLVFVPIFPCMSFLERLLWCVNRMRCNWKFYSNVYYYITGLIYWFLFKLPFSSSCTDGELSLYRWFMISLKILGDRRETQIHWKVKERKHYSLENKNINTSKYPTGVIYHPHFFFNVIHCAHLSKMLKNDCDKSTY